MDRTKDISGVEIRPRFSLREPSIKVLVHQAGAVLGYDKVISQPPLQLRGPNPEVSASPAAPAAPEPLQKRAGERFGPIELPDSIKQKYDTRPLGTLPLLSESAAWGDERSEVIVHEPVTARMLAPRREKRPLVLGAMLVGSAVLGTWAALAFMRSGQDETTAPTAHAVSTRADARPPPAEHPGTAEWVSRSAPPAVPDESAAKPRDSMPRPSAGVGLGPPTQQGQSVARRLPPRAGSRLTSRPKAPVAIEAESRASMAQAIGVTNQPLPPNETPPSKEANDLMLGQW